jgi:hypothetical protein
MYKERESNEPLTEIPESKVGVDLDRAFRR